MRTNELLNALAKGKDGLSITLDDIHARVSTNYVPWVVGCGDTLMKAARNCALEIYGVLDYHPEYKAEIQDVLDALADYDTHSELLRI